MVCARCENRVRDMREALSCAEKEVYEESRKWSFERSMKLWCLGVVMSARVVRIFDTGALAL